MNDHTKMVEPFFQPQQRSQWYVSVASSEALSFVVRIGSAPACKDASVQLELPNIYGSWTLALCSGCWAWEVVAVSSLLSLSLFKPFKRWRLLLRFPCLPAEFSSLCAESHRCRWCCAVAAARNSWWPRVGASRDDG